MIRTFTSVAQVEAAVGGELDPGEWFTIDQDMVDRFADLTGDHEWLHVDREQAAHGPFGGTIAHGFLTMSLVPTLGWSVLELALPGQLVHYGMEHVRFPRPVLVGSRVRLRITPLAVTAHERGQRLVLRHVVEREGHEAPACVADMVFLHLDDVSWPPGAD